MKRIYFFNEGNAQMRDLLGGKGANLAEMTRLGLPVPPGFTITTEVCQEFYENGEKLPDGLMDEVKEAMHELERRTEKKFGSPDNPLLVSVRSGAAVSMPGMMDTILNLGLNDEVVKGLAKLTNNERFAYDAYRRFIQMFSDVVFGVPKHRFEEIIEEYKAKRGVTQDYELPTEDLKEMIEKFKAIFKEYVGMDFPQDPMVQLEHAITAVFRSWNNERAIAYRKYYNITGLKGTAVNVQTMVFGNMGMDSGAGVAFSRDPKTGKKELMVEFGLNAQGEDVVAGIRTPLPKEEFKRRFPEVYKQLEEIARKLETHYKDIQDIEFTVERGKLYFLQTRNAKRTPIAALVAAIDMLNEGLIDERTAILRVSPDQIKILLHPMLDPTEEKKSKPIAKGINASPGGASGKAVFDKETAIEWANRGEAVILVRKETTPEDFGGMVVASGILTSRGGATSHAAVVARGIGKPAVVGAEAIEIDYAKRQFRVGDVVVKEGDWISINGTTGAVYAKYIPAIPSEVIQVALGKKDPKDAWLWPYYKRYIELCNKYRQLGVRANADVGRDAKVARALGAEGIGLARTEHMFVGEDRVQIVRRMIMAETPEKRREALKELIPLQVEDFKDILSAMEGYPVIIRLLDPPLHEFLPSYESLMNDLFELTLKMRETTDINELYRLMAELEEKRSLLRKVEELKEANPMLGLRMCRLGLLFPEIYEAQVEAAMIAATELVKEGKDIKLEIMVPGVSHESEMKALREMIERKADEVMNRAGVKVKYMIGTMIELPRAALTADRLAKWAEFFSYGTNDLTQTTFGFSRDDAERSFLPYYMEHGIIPFNPFEKLDRDGVGQLMKIGIEKGRSTRPELEVGICGEHGGEPSSVEFCHIIGLDYVSCSPYRVPVAIVSAAHAALKFPRERKEERELAGAHA